MRVRRRTRDLSAHGVRLFAVLASVHSEDGQRIESAPATWARDWLEHLTVARCLLGRAGCRSC